MKRSPRLLLLLPNKATCAALREWPFTAAAAVAVTVAHQHMDISYDAVHVPANALHYSFKLPSRITFVRILLLNINTHTCMHMCVGVGVFVCGVLRATSLPSQIAAKMQVATNCM